MIALTERSGECERERIEIMEGKREEKEEDGERLKHLTKFIWLVYDLSPEISNNGPGWMCTAFGRKIYQ